MSMQADLPAVLAALLGRRSVSPKRLAAPGPDAQHIGLMLRAALRAPDHGGLHPWRVLEFAAADRAALALDFEHEKRRRDPQATPDDLRRTREQALTPPVLLAFIVAPRPGAPVPIGEQWLSAGAALGNLLNAAHLLGWGASMLSGERCLDAALRERLGIGADETLAGFVSIGSIAKAPTAAPEAATAQVWQRWQA